METMCAVMSPTYQPTYLGTLVGEHHSAILHQSHHQRHAPRPIASRHGSCTPGPSQPHTNWQPHNRSSCRPTIDPRQWGTPCRNHANSFKPPFTIIASLLSTRHNASQQTTVSLHAFSSVSSVSDHVLAAWWADTELIKPIDVGCNLSNLSPPEKHLTVGLGLPVDPAHPIDVFFTWGEPTANQSWSGTKSEAISGQKHLSRHPTRATDTDEIEDAEFWVIVLSSWSLMQTSRRRTGKCRERVFAAHLGGGLPQLIHLPHWRSGEEITGAAADN